MFVVRDIVEYDWPVRVMLPDGTAGDFKACFAVRTDVREAMLDPTRHETLMRELLCGWTDLVDENGAQVPYSAEMRDRLLADPWVGPAIVRAFVESLTARRGNG